MIHPASRLEVIVHSRADGRNAVKSAAYTARAVFSDERLGKRFYGTGKAGLLSDELINWSGSAEDLWNAAERAETRSNARVIRELRPSLPRELPLSEQVRLVRGYCLWLRDEYGVAIQANIHAPRFLDPAREKLHMAGKLNKDWDNYLATLYEPTLTNQNFHAHLLMTSRQVCRESGDFGAKTRVLDDKKTGPQEILKIRREWEKRANAALKKLGSSARLDLRSYADMANAGDAPAGLVAQDHLGPRRAARSRKMIEEQGRDTSQAGRNRKKIRDQNDQIWLTWLQRRTIEREKNRRDKSASIALEREAQRKEKADAEKRRLLAARTAKEAQVAVETSSQIDSFRTDLMWEQAISSAAGASTKPPCEEADEFSLEVELETYAPPQGPPPPDPFLTPRVERVRQKAARHL
jgi:hypothetical protein